MSENGSGQWGQPMMQQQQTVIVKKGGCGCGTCAIVLLILILAPVILGFAFKIAIITAIFDAFKHVGR